MNTKPVYLTAEGLEKLKAELNELVTVERPRVAARIHEAKLDGDLSENAGYHAAKDEQGHMEGRIRQLEHLLEQAEITDEQRVYTVLYDGDAPDQAERYVVGNLEEQVEGAVLVSPSSPLGTALEGASEGQEVTYQAPNGALKVTVLKVELV